MIFDPFGMDRLSVLMPFWTRILQLLEVVIEGQEEIEIIHPRILHSDDVVLFEQVLGSLIELEKLEKVDRVVR